MSVFLGWCNDRGTQLGDLSSVSEVGAGLFLGLALVQLIGSGGITRLRRKASYLRAVITTNRLRGQISTIRRVEAELLRLELSLETLSRNLLCICFMFLAGSLIGLTAVSLRGDWEIGCLVTGGVLFYYLVLPLLIFLLASVIIRNKCRLPSQSLEDCETEVLSRLSNWPQGS